MGSTAMQKLVLGLVIFLGVHSIRILAPDLRDRMVASMGASPWKIVYSLASLVGFALIVGGYAQARLEPVLLYNPPLWLRHVAALIMLPVFPLLVAAYLPGRIKTAVKHPMLVATKAWAVAHLLVNGMLADVLLFGGFLAWAVLDRISVGKRPQSAVAKPTATWRNDIIAVVVGLVLYVFFVKWAHMHLIGVAPFG
jgi:uncharacterized membrane protein